MLGVTAAGGDLVGYVKRTSARPGKTYPHGCTSEVYNSDRYPYFEMEILGPVVRLAPGESFEMEERQAVLAVARWPDNESSVNRISNT